MERIIKILGSSLSSESFTGFQLSLPYFESLNTLVDYDSELDYSTLSTNNSSNPTEKLITRLSPNPTHFEKKLRSIVLELYSDSGPKGPRDIIAMDSNRGTSFTSPMTPSPSFTVVTPQGNGTLSIHAPPSLHNATAELDHTNLHHSSGEASFTEGVAGVEPSRIQTVQELRGYLKSFHFEDATDFYRNRNSSTESDVVTPSFEDSGIHLEFATSDPETSDNEADVADHSVRDGKRRRTRDELGDTVDGGREDAHVFTSFPVVWTKAQQAKSEFSLQQESSKTLVSKDQSEASLVMRSDRKPDAVSRKPDVHGSRNQISTAHDTNQPRQLQVRNGLLDSISKARQGSDIVIREPGMRIQDQIIHSSTTSQSDVTQDHSIEPSNIGISVPVDEMQESERTVREADQRYHQLVHERANMEGKLETLSVEYRTVLEERKELQTQVRALETKTRNGFENKTEYTESEDQDLRLYHENKAQLENQIVELQDFLSARDLQVNDVDEKLTLSEACVQRLQEKICRFEAGFASKDTTISTLERELSDLKISLEQARDKNEEFCKDEQVLNSDVSSLLKAKTWYQKQLETAKEARVRLQLEVSEYETTVASQNKIVENLKCENARTSQQLIETQHKTLEEKTRILKHLERVEEDMLHQDAAFRQMQLDKQRVERDFSTKIDLLQAENTQLQTLTGSAKTLEAEIETLKKDTMLQHDTLKRLQMEKEEVYQQLKVARGVNEIHEKKLRALNTKLVENETVLKSVVSKQEFAKENITRLKEEKLALEVKVREAEEERVAFDSAVQMLRLELEKVERRFKFMKRELATKTTQLDDISKQKDGFIHELGVLRDEMDKHMALLEELRDTVRVRNGTIEQLRSDKAKLEDEIRVLSDRLRCAQMICAEAEQERKALLEQLLTATSHVLQLEEKVHKSLLEKARLEGELETTVRVSTDEANANKTQNESLKQEMAEIQKRLQREVTRNRDEAINLEQQVEYFKGQVLERNEEHETELKKLEEKLALLKKNKDLTENEFKKSQDFSKAHLDDLKQRYERQIHKIQGECSLLQTLKNYTENKCAEIEQRATTEITSQKQKVQRLERELQTVRKALEARKQEIENMSLVSIELEREKGRLSGVMASQKTLRQHCAKMEESIAQRESILADLESQVVELEREKELQQSSSKKRISQLESALSCQRDHAQELQNSLIAERKENSNLRLKLAESEEEVERVMKKLCSTCLEAENVTLKYNRCCEELKDCMRNLEIARNDLRQSQIFCGKLQSELTVLRDRDQVRDDQVTSLEWEMKQRCKEVDYMKEQLRLSEERQQIELENLRTAFQVAKSEAVCLRSELTEARKAKCIYQSRVFEIKDEVLTSRQETETIKQELFESRQQLRCLKLAILNAEDLSVLKAVTEKEAVPSAAYKETMVPSSQVTSNIQSPLFSLRDCMSSLRSQISSLQSQMNEHTDAIHTATSSWRSFEKNVKDLHDGYIAVHRPQILLAEKR